MAKQEESKEGSKTCAILRCNCSHEYQDRRYGKGKRLHNLKTKTIGRTCTVCGSVK